MSPTSKPVPRTTIVALAAIAVLFLTLTIQKICVPDLWWQLATGRHVLHHGWPSTDAFSYSAPGNPWIEPRWIYCILMDLGDRLGGPSLLILFQSALYALTFTILLWPSRRSLLTFPGLLTLFFALGSIEMRFNVRPEMFTYLFMAITLVTLDRATRPESSPRARQLMWLLPILQVIWTNTHTVFILGPVIAWAFVLGDFIHRFLRIGRLGFTHTANPWKPTSRLDLPLVGVAVAITAATLINPWFTRGALFPLTLWSETMGGTLGLMIQELVPPRELWPYWPLGVVAGAIFAALSALSFLFNWRRTNFIRLGLWLAFLFLADRSVRNLAPFGFVALWATLRNLDDLYLVARHSVPGIQPAASHAERRKTPAAHSLPLGGSAGERGANATSTPPSTSNTKLIPLANLALAALSLYSAWYIATDRLASRQNSPRLFGLGVTPWVIPDRAVNFMLAHRVKGNVFHSMNDGSYLDFAAEGTYPVFVDGRLEVFGEPLILAAADAGSIIEEWDAFTARHHINAALVERDTLQAVIPYLARRPDWPAVYIDERCVVFVKDIPDHADLIASSRFVPGVAYTPPFTEPDDTRATLPAFLGGRSTPGHTLGMARSFFLLGSTINAQHYLQQTVDHFPDHRRPRLMLATLIRSEGKVEESERLVAGITPLQPDEVIFADRLLADVHGMSGRPAARLAVLKSLTQVTPDDAGTWKDLAQSATASGNHMLAAEAWTNVSRLEPGNLLPRSRIAMAYEAAGRYDLALPIAEELATKGRMQHDPATGRETAVPLMPEMSFHLGWCLLNLNRTDEAIAAYRAGLRYTPGNADAHNSLGILLYRKGDKQAARDAFAEALRLRPDLTNIKKNIERIDAELSAPATPK